MCVGLYSWGVHECLGLCDMIELVVTLWGWVICWCADLGVWMKIHVGMCAEGQIAKRMCSADRVGQLQLFGLVGSAEMHGGTSAWIRLGCECLGTENRTGCPKCVL